MDEGKELLYQAIDKKIDAINSISEEDVIYDGVNLALLSTSLDESIENLSNVSDSIIDMVLIETKTEDSNMRKTLIQLRDLLIGKRDYNLDVKISKAYENAFKKFKTSLEKLLKKKAPGIKNISETKENVISLKESLDRNDVIIDFKTIETIMKEYNNTKFDTNMLKVMKFININNLTKIDQKENPISKLDINKVKRVKLDDKWNDILTKLDIDYKELPNYLVSEMVRANPSDVRNVFDLIRKNKAEEYGILHLIDKENIVAKIVLMIYSDVDTIKEIVDSFVEDNKTDVQFLKVVINNLLGAFISKDNNYFTPKHREYMKNLNILKDIDINYKILIKRCPLFMLINNDVLSYTLKYSQEYGCDSKQLINRCYKTIAINPEIILGNMSILKRYNINLDEYFTKASDNYNLLKVPDLEKKLEYIIKSNNIDDTSDYNLLNKLLINELSKSIIGGAK